MSCQRPEDLPMAMELEDWLRAPEPLGRNCLRSQEIQDGGNVQRQFPRPPGLSPAAGDDSREGPEFAHRANPVCHLDGGVALYLERRLSAQALLRANACRQGFRETVVEKCKGPFLASPKI